MSAFEQIYINEKGHIINTRLRVYIYNTLKSSYYLQTHMCMYVYIYIYITPDIQEHSQPMRLVLQCFRNGSGHILMVSLKRIRTTTTYAVHDKDYIQTIAHNLKIEGNGQIVR